MSPTLSRCPASGSTRPQGAFCSPRSSPCAPHTSRGAQGARGAPWGCRRRQGEMLVLRRGGASGVLLWGLGGTRCQRWAVGAPARPQRPSPWDLLRGCLWLPEDAAAPLCWGFGVRRGQRLAPCVSAGRGLLWYIGAGSAARGGTGVSPGCHRGITRVSLCSRCALLPPVLLAAALSRGSARPLQHRGL